jgi:hypothetical protein
VIVGDNPKPSPQVMPVQKPGGPEQDGSAREGDPGVKPQQARVAEAIRKHITRVASDGKKFSRERYDSELAKDLDEAGLNGSADLLAAKVNEKLARDLAEGVKTQAEVYNQAKADAPRMAAYWMLPVEELKAIGIPDEYLWERMGFSSEEIDQMRALRLAESLAGEG